MRLINVLFYLLLIPKVLAAQWNAVIVGHGIKPDIVVSSGNIAQIGFMSEDIDGYLAFTQVADTADIRVDTILYGYFYGPVAMALGPDNKVFLSVHDHDSEAERIAEKSSNASWIFSNIESSGHDGWDTDILVDSYGNIYTSSVDPTQGIEYAYRTNDQWSKVTLPTDPINYSYATSIAQTSEGQVFIAFYDTNKNALRLARQNGSGWFIETVSGQGGLFPSMAVDKNDQIHIAFANRLEANQYEIKYAVSNNKSWDITTIDTLARVLNSGRRIVTIAIDPSNHPTLAYTDAKVIKYAINDLNGWKIEKVIDYTGQSRTLGVSMAHQVTDKAIHIATYTQAREVLYFYKIIDGSIGTSQAYNINGRITNEKNIGVKDVLITVDGFNIQAMSDNNGDFQLKNVLGEVTLTLSKSDDPARGVSSSDLITISNHIIGRNPIQHDLQLRAADVNDSGSITGADLVLLKNLLLGKSNMLPAGNTWIFDNNTKKYNIDNVKNGISIKAWKYGDVNNSADPKN